MEMWKWSSVNRKLLISLILKGSKAVGHKLEEDMDSRKVFQRRETAAPVDVLTGRMQ